MLPGMKTGWPTVRKSVGDLRRARREGARRPLAVHEEVAAPVALDLRNVVGNVVDLSGRLSHLRAEHAGDRLADAMGHRVPVGEGEVGGRRHGCEIRAAFRGGGGRAGELTVRYHDLVAGVDGIHRAHVVGADLMAEPARARMNEHGDLILVQPERLGGSRVEDTRHPLQLDEVIACAGRAELPGATLVGPCGDSSRISPL
jgi:hypothetical protein